jgi:ATP-dependent RNA helicase DDX18/HAS1
MTATEIDSKKRKRKHNKTKKGEEAEPVKAHSNGVAAVEKPRKKSKKEHTPEPEVEDAIAEASENGVESEVEEDEEQLNKELKQIAAKAKLAKVNQDEEESEDEQDAAVSGANAVDLPSGTSIPTVDDPTRFDELKLSDRTMEAIKTMGFENMTEIQRKAIPPLLR